MRDRRFRPAVEAVESRVVPTRFRPGPIPDGVVLVPTDNPGEVRVLDGGGGAEVGVFVPFDDFTGEVRWATGDVTGDGYSDLIVGAGPGGAPRVRVFDGRNMTPVFDFYAFDRDFTGGVYLAATDAGEVVAGAGEGGGPRVRVFDPHVYPDLRAVADFYAFEPELRGGVRVAADHVSFYGIGNRQVIAVPGPGGGPRVSVFDLSGFPSPAQTSTFYAYDPDVRTGLNLTTTPRPSPTGTFPFSYVVTAPAAGGGPNVRVFDADTGTMAASYFAGSPDDRGGLAVYGNQSGVVTAPAADARLSYFGAAGFVWALPPGTVRAAGRLGVADPAAGTVNLVTSSGDDVFAVRADAVIRRSGAVATLADLVPGDFVDAAVDDARRVVELTARPVPPATHSFPLPPFPPPTVSPPAPAPA